MILFRTNVSVEGKYTDGTERSFSTIFPKVPPYWHMTLSSRLILLSTC